LRQDDLRALGRVGQPVHLPSGRSRRRLSVRRAGTATVATRRPAIPRPLVVVVLVVVATLVYLGVAAAGQADPLAAVAAQPAVTPSAPDTGAAVVDNPRRPAAQVARSARAEVSDAQTFAEVEGLELALPHDRPLAIAFHEATRPEALPLIPVGVLETNDNPTKYHPVADIADAPPYRVLSSRGRGRPATSAVDIAVPDGTVAMSPVTGEVVEVRQYVLYGGLHDWRVVIAPDSRPDLHVVMIHLHQPQVEEGERVVAGTNAIGVARLLPFSSHVDYTLEGRNPHVHLEVKPATAATPLDPNEPAVMPEERDLG
jgi:murein DD-endopeptidase MepM/ murein hydrolase activator NlpD